MSEESQIWHGTTILSVRKGPDVVIAGDGQVSLGATVIKGGARKVRRFAKGDVIAALGRLKIGLKKQRYHTEDGGDATDTLMPNLDFAVTATPASE